MVELDYELLSTASRIVIRASSTPELLDCPRRWAGRQLGRLLDDMGYPRRVLPNHVGAPIGTGTHAAIAHMLRTKGKTGTLPPFPEAEEIGSVAMMESFEERGEVIWDNTAADLNDAHKQLYRLSHSYFEQRAPFVNAILVEKRLEADWPDHPKFVVSGQMDQLLRLDPVNDALWDVKTGSQPKGVLVQVGTYAKLHQTYRDAGMLEDVLGPHAPSRPLGGLAVEFGPRVELRKPQPSYRTVELDMEEAKSLSIQAIERAVTFTDRFLATQDLREFPANPSSVLCSDRFCPLWGTTSCRAHAPAGLK